jgi:ADP-dependent NAD(P)H-hydrate dehydratase
VKAPVPVSADTLRDWPLPAPASEKHGRGVVLVVGGSAGTPGAALLAGEAAMRAGCGQLKIATVASAAAQVAVAMPEARVHGFAETDSGNLCPDVADRIAAAAEGADAVLVGSGFVEADDSAALVAALVGQVRTAVVIDALASAYLADHPDLADVHAGCVLTVNPAELGHVLGLDTAEINDDPVGAVSRVACGSGAAVLLGGEVKTIGAPDGRTYEVTAGGPGMATSGSGDVQAGLVAGLLARGADPVQAAAWGAWLHAVAGDRLAERIGPIGFLARELLTEVPALLAGV